MWRHILSALLLAATFLPVAVTHAQGDRVLTGEGGEKLFDVTQPVVGAYLEYIDGWHTTQPCYLPRAEEPGRVISGAIGLLFAGEIVGKPICEFVEPESATAQAVETEPIAPAPEGPPAPKRRLSGEGNWMYFAPGEQVQGYNIRLRSNNFQWKLCRFDSAPGDGWVLSGVAYPYADEVAQMGTCDPNKPFGVMTSAQPAIPPPSA